MHGFHSRRFDVTPPNLAAVPQRKAQCIESTRFPDRHFWHGGYDKAWIDDASYEEFQVAVVRKRTTIQAAGEEMLEAWMQGQGVRLPGR